MTSSWQKKETIMQTIERPALIELGAASVATEGTLPGNQDFLAVGSPIGMSDDD